MFIFRAKDSFATLIIIVPRFARADNDKIRDANESSALKMNIIVILTLFTWYISKTYDLFNGKHF